MDAGGKRQWNLGWNERRRQRVLARQLFLYAGRGRLERLRDQQDRGLPYGAWYLDTTGDGQWSQAAYFGQAGDIPLVGDWSNSGKSCIGVFRNGGWIIAMDGAWTWDGVGTGDSAFWLGNSSYVPVPMPATPSR